MAKRASEGASPLPQKRGRFDDAGTPNRSKAPSFGKRRLQLQQVSPSRVRMNQIRSSPLRRAMKRNITVLKRTRKTLNSPLRASEPLHLSPREKPITIALVATDERAGPSEPVLATAFPHSTRSEGGIPEGVQLQDIIEGIRSTYPELVVESVVKEKSFVVVHQSDLNTVCSAGPIHNPRMVISIDGQCVPQMEFQLFFQTVSKEAYSRQALVPHLESMLRESGYCVCPGIPEYPSEIRFKSKNYREWQLPFKRHDSQKCKLWHKPQHHRRLPDDPLYNCCPSCRLLWHDLCALTQRARKASPRKRSNWQLPSSRRPMKYLSPRSVKIRRTLTRLNQKMMMKSLKHYKKYDITLHDDQSNELLQLVSAISDIGQDELQKVVKEADKKGRGNILRNMWKLDVEDRLKFQKDQKKNVSGKRGNRWSIITFRMASAVCTRSPSAYEALKSFHIIQLPGVRTLKDYINSNREDPGKIQERLKLCREEYDRMVAMQQQLGNKQVPLSKGVLIFDEVKVGLNVQWNSRTDEFIGHSMTSKEMSTLHDVYEHFDQEDKTTKTSYVLQTLWRDLTSDYDIIGPYYTSSDGLKSVFLVACIYDAIRQFEQFNFSVVAVTCDGASSNLTALKALCHRKGAYGHDPSLQDQHEVPVTFSNPYTGSDVFMIICPSHQLKNMIAALHASRPGGTKNFEIDGCNFGWKALEDMFFREVERSRTNQLRRVKDLKESYIYRDSWTRLNVKPAKIMQQEHVIAELKEHMTTTPPPPYAANVALTVKYLEACNKMFERGILGHVRIWSGDSEILRNMEEGYTFFCAWIDGHLQKKANPVDSTFRAFLAWQTWDLLRIMWQGFKLLCRDFTTQNPGYYISPLRLNGSAVETLFSRLKFISHGDLTATRYPQALASLITKGSIQGQKVSGSCSYRDATLYVRRHELTKRSKKKS